MKRPSKAKRRFFYRMDWLLAVIIFLSMGLFRIDDVLLISYILVVPYFILTKRSYLLFYFTIASIISLGWMLISKDLYVNTSYYLHSIGINLYPMLVWALALTGTYILLDHYAFRLKLRSFRKQLTLYVVLYWPVLIVAETIGYHMLNIRNEVTANNQGLPLCDCIHAPVWMQIAYFAIGPLFFITAYVVHMFRKEIIVTFQKLSPFNEESL